MQNYFDYDLFANPLNPPTGSAVHPHPELSAQLLRPAEPVQLRHGPVSHARFSFRVDYNRNRIIGPSFSSVHQGTEALTNQNYDNTLNGYRFGVDFRVNKKTTLSYTQLLQYYVGATYGLNNFNSWPLSNGNPGHLRTSLVQQRQPVQRAPEERNRQSLLQRLLRLRSLTSTSTRLSRPNRST